MNFFNERAKDTFSEMLDKPIHIGLFYGTDSEEYHKANESLLHVIRFLIQNEETAVIYGDSPLGLYVSLEYMDCGIIWFPSKDEKYKNMTVVPGEWSIHS